MKKDTNQIQRVKVIAADKPRSVKLLMLEAGIVPDDYKAEQFLKSGAVTVNRNSAHPGMTVAVKIDEPVQLSIYEERFALIPVSQEDMLDTYDPNERWSDEALSKDGW